MRFGFGTLRLAPREFWGLTPRELASAFEGLSGRTRPQPPDRATIDRLLAAFPDEVIGASSGSSGCNCED